MVGIHTYVEPIVVFTCACTYSYLTIESQFVYQFVSEAHKFTKNQSFTYCNGGANATISASTREQIVADEVAYWTKVASILKAIANAISVLVITSWSDAIGRRNALLFPVVGALTTSLLLLLNVYSRISLIIYIVSSFVYGATGGWVTLINVSTAHLSDIIDRNARGYRYTLLEIFASLGGGLSQIGTGYWFRQYGFLPPTIFIVCCAATALLLTISLKTKSPKKSELSTVSVNDKMTNISDHNTASDRQPNVPAFNFRTILSQLREVFRIYTSNRIKCTECDDAGVACVHCVGQSKNRVWRLWLFLITYIIYMANVDGFELFMTMFLVSFPLCFTPELVGALTGLESSIMILSPLAIWLFRSLLRFSVQSTLLTAISGRIVTSILMFLSTTPTLVFIGTAMGVLSTLTTPFIRVQVSNLVSPTEQGTTLALIPSVAKMVNIISPLVILTIYTSTLYIRHSFIWAILAIFFSLTFLLMSIVWVIDKINFPTNKTPGANSGEEQKLVE